MHPYNALSIFGQSGSGKTLLGNLIQCQGLGGRSFFHLDLGAQLRTARQKPEVMTFLDDSDQQVIARVLNENRLFADDEFPVAEKIFRHYLDSVVGDGSWVVLNGLPRNFYQAAAVESLVTVKLVVLLECSSADAGIRIASNIRHERDGRTDSQPDAVAARLEIFQRQTMPLLQRYRQTDARIIEFAVLPETTPEEIWKVLNNIRLD